LRKKATKNESTFRTQTIYGMLCDGKSRSDILRFATEEWGLSERQGETYLSRAYTLLEKDCEMARPAFLSELLGGIRSIRQQAERRGQMQVALNAIRLQAELVGLAGK
jgi:hypothetical protein